MSLQIRQPWDEESVSAVHWRKMQNILVAGLGRYSFGEVLQMCSLVKASLVRGTSRPGLGEAEPSGCAQLEA